MSEEFKKYKDSFMKNNFYNTEEITQEEYQLVPDSEQEYYYFETFEKGNNSNNISEIGYIYYKKTPVQLSNEEFNLFLQMKQLEINEQMDNKQNTMKSIMIFWLILTIVNLIGLFYIISKISSVLSY